MSSTFGGISFFDSGPHRFRMESVGRLVLSPFRGPNQLPKHVDFGTLDVRIAQAGRLIAASDVLVWALIDAIRTEADSVLAKTLVDHHGRTWTGMTLTRFEPSSFFDRGRNVSVGYEAEYVRFVP